MAYAAPMRDKKRTTLIVPDDFHCLIRPIIRQVILWPEPLLAAIVKRIGKIHPSPKKLIDGIKWNPGVDNVGIVFRQIESTAMSKLSSNP